MQKGTYPPEQTGSNDAANPVSPQHGKPPTRANEWSINELHTRLVRPTPKAEKIDAYNESAGQYEDLMRGLKWEGPSMCAEILWPFMLQSSSSSSAPLRVLDAGCGTGLCGAEFERLIAVAGNGAPELYKIGVDYSQEMLELAKPKSIYDELICADLDQPLSIERVQFIMASGVFLEGHCGPHTLQTMLGTLEEGGYACLTVRKASFQMEEREYIEAVEKGGCKVVECEARPYADVHEGMYLVIRKKT